MRRLMNNCTNVNEIVSAFPLINNIAYQALYWYLFGRIVIEYRMVNGDMQNGWIIVDILQKFHIWILLAKLFVKRDLWLSRFHLKTGPDYENWTDCHRKLVSVGELNGPVLGVARSSFNFGEDQFMEHFTCSKTDPKSIWISWRWRIHSRRHPEWLQNEDIVLTYFDYKLIICV